MAINLLKGIIIGIICGTPIGAAGAMTIQRTLKFGAKHGLLTGLGASFADCIYASAGVFGIKFVADFMKDYNAYVNAVGGCIVIFIAFTILHKKEVAYNNGGGLKHFVSAFTVGITNPVVILAFIMAFSYLNIENVSMLNGSITILGVFIGTYLWWLALTGISCFIKKRSHEDILRKLNIICGIILIAFGALMIIKGILNFLKII